MFVLSLSLMKDVYIVTLTHVTHCNTSHKPRKSCIQQGQVHILIKKKIKNQTFVTIFSMALI